jgi:hypothetical protein
MRIKLRLNMKIKFWNLFVKKVEKNVVYSPKEDITSYEVSKCLEIMIGLFNYSNVMGYENAKKFVLRYPIEVSRHFTLE